MSVPLLFNIVRFSPAQGTGEAAIALEGPFKFSAGLKPNINSAVCSYIEFEKIKDQLGQPGTVGFYCNSDSSADVEIQQIILIDAEPIDYGMPADGGGDEAIATKYRLTFVDSRYQYVLPRGGRLRQGILNPSFSLPADPDKTESAAAKLLSELIQDCLTAMGSDASVPAGAIDQVKPPMDLKWFGTHAPTELSRLLAMANCVFVLQPDGSEEIYALGEGGDPVIDAGQALPETSLAGADARGKTVVFSSYPRQVAGVYTMDDLGGNPLQIVYFNSNETPQKIDDCGVYGTDAISEMNHGFPTAKDPSAQWGCYRYVQLSPDNFDPDMEPLLRKTWDEPDGSESSRPNGLPPMIDIELSARIAVQDPSTKLWSNASDFVKVPLLNINSAWNILTCGMRLVKLKSGVTATADLEGNCDKIDMTADIKIRFAAGESDWDSAKEIFQPRYFHVGFSGAGGAASVLHGDDAIAAMNIPDTIVVPLDDLVAVIMPSAPGGNTGEPINKQALEDRCQSLSTRYLKDAATPARVLGGWGFIDFTLNGVVGEVELDAERLLTRFKLSSFFRPTGSYLASEFKRLEDPAESHPHQSRTQAQFTAQGQAGSSQPVAPLGEFASPPLNELMQVVSLGKDGGADGSASSTTYASWTYTISPLAGGAALATQVPVRAPRLFAAATTPATLGIVVKGSGGGGVNPKGGAQNLILVCAFEQIAQALCS